MKRLFQIIIAMFIAFYSFSTVSAQENTEITFSITKINGKLINSNAQEQKAISFSVFGLSSNEEVDAFIAKFKQMKFVVDITISYDFLYGKRIGSATFQSDATSVDIKNAMLNAGVTHVFIHEKKYPISDVQIDDTEK